VQHKVFCGPSDGCFDYVTRHPQPAVIARYGAHACAGFNAVGRGVSKSYFREDPENIFPDCGQAFITKWFVVTTRLARQNRFVFRGKG
jgi:hypothetical protein